LDSGDVIYSSETEIGEFETSAQLFERLRDLGAELLCKTVHDIELGSAPRTPQNAEKATFAPPLTKEMSPIDWSKSPREIVKHICGLNPWPVATAELMETPFRIFGAEYTENQTDKPAGTIVSADSKKGIEVACGNGETLLITRLQAPAGKQMSAADYLRGHPMHV
ncbi:MAG: methionyl-tRNA formyltransferase, partial [Clostridia bacterium]|nr:methionyl-tRNA formyltransferase [Clostridia bacterium]